MKVKLMCFLVWNYSSSLQYSVVNSWKVHLKGKGEVVQCLGASQGHPLWPACGTPLPSLRVGGKGDWPSCHHWRRMYTNDDFRKLWTSKKLFLLSVNKKLLTKSALVRLGAVELSTITDTTTYLLAWLGEWGSFIVCYKVIWNSSW